MGEITKKDLEHKLHIQHRNTRHDAVDIVNEYYAEVAKHNEALRRLCTTGPVFDPGGAMILGPRFDDYKYRMNRMVIDQSVLTQRLMNMKQRKPKQGE